MLNRLLKKTLKIYYVFKIKKIAGFTFGKGLVIRGKPIINVTNGGNINIGDNVTLNSENEDYHVNMYAPVKLLVDRPSAKIIIGNNTRIHGSCLHAYNLISVGDNCLIAANCQIFDGSGHDLCMDEPVRRLTSKGEAKPVLIEKNVWIGANCIILPGVQVGEGSVVAAGSVVVKSVPKNVLVGGNPARIIAMSS